MANITYLTLRLIKLMIKLHQRPLRDAYERLMPISFAIPHRVRFSPPAPGPSPNREMTFSLGANLNMSSFHVSTPATTASTSPTTSLIHEIPSVIQNDFRSLQIRYLPTIFSLRHTISNNSSLSFMPPIVMPLTIYLEEIKYKITTGIESKMDPPIKGP